MYDLPRLADLIRSRNTVERNIAALIGRPAHMQEVAEYIAAAIFGIALNDSSEHKDYDGRFVRGPLAGHTVAIQWHSRHSGQLNLRTDPLPDYYLAFMGPKAEAAAFRSIGTPWILDSVYLFEADELLRALYERQVQVGSNTSLIESLWERAELYPVQRNTLLSLSKEQYELLGKFR
jgi:hypothetical protein